MARTKRREPPPHVGNKLPSIEGQQQKARLLAKLRQSLSGDTEGDAVRRRCIALLDAAHTDPEILVAMVEGKALLAADIERNKESGRRALAKAVCVERDILRRMPRPERLS